MRLAAAYRAARLLDVDLKMFEVELKFPLDDDQRVRALLEEIGAAPGQPMEQADRYFNHPARDFGQSDEALRVRTTGGRSRVTYKGPLVDEKSKTRREIEIPIGESAQDGERFAAILLELSFREVRTVRKRRTPYELAWEDLTVEATLDEVDGLGTFCELETTTDEADREAARDALLRLAERLGLANSERRSYLTLLLEQERGN